MTDHKSDCAVHNEPAMKAGPCDCGEGIVEAMALAISGAPFASPASMRKARAALTAALPVLDAYEHMHTRAVRAEAETERLRSHITAARSFRVLNENGQADRHLSEAMKPPEMTVDVDND